MARIVSALRRAASCLGVCVGRRRLRRPDGGQIACERGHVDRRRRLGVALSRPYALEQVHQPRDVVLPARPVRHLDGVPQRECERASREVVRNRHPGAGDECGDDADVASERRLDLEPHIVVRAAQASFAAGVGSRQPARADHHEEHVAGRDCRLDGVLELDADVDRVDVHEHVLRAELVGKGIVETACLAARVLAPVTDEDTHGLRGVVGSRTIATCCLRGAPAHLRRPNRRSGARFRVTSASGEPAGIIA